jgi:hypothetical protein
VEALAEPNLTLLNFYMISVHGAFVSIVSKAGSEVGAGLVWRKGCQRTGEYVDVGP